MAYEKLPITINTEFIRLGIPMEKGIKSIKYAYGLQEQAYFIDNGIDIDVETFVSNEVAEIPIDVLQDGKYTLIIYYTATIDSIEGGNTINKDVPAFKLYEFDISFIGDVFSSNLLFGSSKTNTSYTMFSFYREPLFVESLSTYGLLVSDDKYDEKISKLLDKKFFINNSLYKEYNNKKNIIDKNNISFDKYRLEINLNTTNEEYLNKYLHGLVIYNKSVEAIYVVRFDPTVLIVNKDISIKIVDYLIENKHDTQQ